MTIVYPILLTPAKEGGFDASVPDLLGVHTQGKDLAEAIFMVRDAIGMYLLYEQDSGGTIPTPSDPKSIKTDTEQILTLVDLDLDAYRRRHDNRAVRKNVTLPSWLNELAEQAEINFSLILQEGLKKRLDVHDI